MNKAGRDEIKKTFVVSGIGPGAGGVGRFVEYLVSIGDSSQVEFIFPRRSKLKNNFWRKVVENAVYRPFFRLRLRRLRGEKVVVLHQQTVGLRAMKWLLRHVSDLKLYVMDNGFFCLKAYNHISGETTECLRCISGDTSSARTLACKPQPLTRRPVAQKLQDLIRKHANDIEFVALSETNEALLKRCFGSEIRVSTRYFQTHDLVQSDSGFRSQDLTGTQRYNLVFHGAPLEAKGFEYFLSLAERLPELTFFLPAHDIPARYRSLSNVTYANMTWERGLRQIVEAADIVVTPSLWSFTPEAAMLKSMLYNGCVAVTEREFGFTNEVLSEAYLPLTGMSEDDAQTLRSFMLDGDFNALRAGSRKYLNYYFGRATLDTRALLAPTE